MPLPPSSSSFSFNKRRSSGNGQEEAGETVRRRFFPLLLLLPATEIFIQTCMEEEEGFGAPFVVCPKRAESTSENPMETDGAATLRRFDGNLCVILRFVKCFLIRKKLIHTTYSSGLFSSPKSLKYFLSQYIWRSEK